MQATFKHFISCLFCLSLLFWTGCTDTITTMGRGGSTVSEKPPTLTPAEQSEVDGIIKWHGRNAIVYYLEAAQKDRNADETLALKYLQHFVSQGANVNAKGRDNATPLHLAAESGSVKIIEFLVSKGADVNAKNAVGETPLHGYGARTNLEIAEFLISKRADVNAKNSEGDTPLHHAVRWGENPDWVTFLVSKGANVNTKNERGETPADVARKRLREAQGGMISTPDQRYTAEVSREILAILGDQSQ